MGNAVNPTTERGEDRVEAAVRVQILATEHWSLLATRSMTWAEVLGRIAAHLTMTSAALVSLALVVQLSGFGAAFRALSISISGAVLLLGTLTLMRVVNASEEDLGLVIGMNRLRQAYVDLDPGVADYLVTGHGDGYDAVARSYVPFGRRGARCSPAPPCS